MLSAVELRRPPRITSAMGDCISLPGALPLTARGMSASADVSAVITIGRRSHWTQPMFEALGSAIFGLITTEINGRKKFLIHAVPEVGCFDQIEFAPTVQIEPGEDPKHFEPITKLFFKLLENKTCVKTDIMLSEEGGRFYCEQNRNLILDVPKQAVEELPAGYFWLDYKTLNYMVQFNNCLNIQLRNLISLLEI